MVNQSSLAEVKQTKAGVALEGRLGVIGAHFAKMTPSFGFLAAFGGPPLSKL